MKVRALASTLAAATLGWIPAGHAHVQDQPRGARGTVRDIGQGFEEEVPAWRHYFSARGPGFQVGSPLPQHFRQRHYVVKDYSAHGLPRPPRSHHWVQIGPDYVLVGIASRLITHIQLGL